jgi:hypothetical protein
MSDPIIDSSRVDAYAAARRRAMMLHSAWRPMLAGAAGAALVVAAVYVTLPKFSVREVVVDRVVTRDVPVNNLIPHDVPIEIPRIIESPEEKAFVGTPGWKDAVIRGRILRSDRNGFVLETDAGEESFYPAKIGADGKPEPNLAVADSVDSLIGDLARCNKLPVGTFECVASHNGKTVQIPQKPLGRPT